LLFLGHGVFAFGICLFVLFLCFLFSSPPFALSRFLGCLFRPPDRSWRPSPSCSSNCFCSNPVPQRFPQFPFRFPEAILLPFDRPSSLGTLISSVLPCSFWFLFTLFPFLERHSSLVGSFLMDRGTPIPRMVDFF